MFKKSPFKSNTKDLMWLSRTMEHVKPATTTILVATLAMAIWVENSHCRRTYSQKPPRIVALRQSSISRKQIYFKKLSIITKRIIATIKRTNKFKRLQIVNLERLARMLKVRRLMHRPCRNLRKQPALYTTARLKINVKISKNLSKMAHRNLARFKR